MIPAIGNPLRAHRETIVRWGFGAFLLTLAVLAVVQTAKERAADRRAANLSRESKTWQADLVRHRSAMAAANERKRADSLLVDSLQNRARTLERTADDLRRQRVRVLAPVTPTATARPLQDSVAVLDSALGLAIGEADTLRAANQGLINAIDQLHQQNTRAWGLLETANGKLTEADRLVSGLRAEMLARERPCRWLLMPCPSRWTALTVGVVAGVVGGFVLAGAISR